MKRSIRNHLTALALTTGIAGLIVACSPAPAVAAPAESPDQAVLDVARGLSEGRLHVAWDALPASYQNDVTDLVHAYASKMDPELWDMSFTIFRKAIDVLESKRDVILAMPKFQNEPKSTVNELRANWGTVLAPFKTLANSELSNIESMKSLDVRNFLATTGSRFFAEIEAMTEVSPSDDFRFQAEFANVTAELVSRNGDSAQVRMSGFGEPMRTETFVRVEGKWIPEEMAREWPAQMAEARAKLGGMSSDQFAQSKPQMMAMLSGIDGTLDALSATENPEQFEQALQMGMFQVFGGIMAMSQALEAE